MSSTPLLSSAPSFVSHVKQTPTKMASSPCSPVTSNSSLKSISSSSSVHSLDLHLTNGTGPQNGNKNLIVMHSHVASDLEHGEILVEQCL